MKGKFWLDGRDYPEFQSCKSKVPKWWRNYFCFAFLGFGTDVSPTPIKSVVLELFDLKVVVLTVGFDGVGTLCTLQSKLDL